MRESTKIAIPLGSMAVLCTVLTVVVVRRGDSAVVAATIGALAGFVWCFALVLWGAARNSESSNNW